MNLFTNNYRQTCSSRPIESPVEDTIKAEEQTEEVIHNSAPKKPCDYKVSPLAVKPLTEHAHAGFLPGYLANKIGKLVRINLALGSAADDRTGILKSVGSGYVVIEQQKGFETVCDLSYIALVTVINDTENNPRMLSFPK